VKLPNSKLNKPNVISKKNIILTKCARSNVMKVGKFSSKKFDSSTLHLRNENKPKTIFYNKRCKN
jgi:hypothetical protein